MHIEISGLDQIPTLEQKKIANTIEDVLTAANLDDYMININLVDAETMKKLNQRFKNKNKVTDVLSFPIPDMEKMFGHTKHILGDVIICVDQAQKQADKFGHSLPEEIAVLVAHGFFHLLGYDHEISEDEANIQMQGEMYLLEVAGFSPHLSLIGRV